MAIGDKIPVEAIKKALAENPVLKWAVIGFVAIFAVEFLAKEGIALVKEITTLPSTIERTVSENKAIKAREDIDYFFNRPWTPEEKAEHDARANEPTLAEAKRRGLPPYGKAPSSPQGDTQEFQDKRQSLAMLLAGLSGAASLVILWRSSRAGAGLSRKTFARRSLRVAPFALAVAYGGPWLAQPLAEVVGLQVEWVWMGLVFSGLFMVGLCLPVMEMLWAVWQLLRKEDGPSFNTD